MDADLVLSIGHHAQLNTKNMDVVVLCSSINARLTQ